MEKLKSPAETYLPFPKKKEKEKGKGEKKKKQKKSNGKKKRKYFRAEVRFLLFLLSVSRNPGTSTREETQRSMAMLIFLIPRYFVEQRAKKGRRKNRRDRIGLMCTRRRNEINSPNLDNYRVYIVRFMKRLKSGSGTSEQKEGEGETVGRGEGRASLKICRAAFQRRATHSPRLPMPARVPTVLRLLFCSSSSSLALSKRKRTAGSLYANAMPSF